MFKATALVLTFGLALTPKAFAQSYSQLEPLNDQQALRLEANGKTSGAGQSQPVINFGVVEKGLYRSGAPASLKEIQALAKMGVKTILDLQNDKKKVAEEAAWAKAAGVKIISIPLSGFWAPHDKDVERIQAILNDPSQRPLLFHCKHGMERTGLEAALYRVFKMHWTPEAAYKEMKAYGFHTAVFPMKNYLEKKTNADL